MQAFKEIAVYSSFLFFLSASSASLSASFRESEALDMFFCLDYDNIMFFGSKNRLESQPETNGINQSLVIENLGKISNNRRRI